MINLRNRKLEVNEAHSAVVPRYNKVHSAINQTANVALIINGARLIWRRCHEKGADSTLKALIFLLRHVCATASCFRCIARVVCVSPRLPGLPEWDCCPIACATWSRVHE
jgi:hypothetical protein